MRHLYVDEDGRYYEWDEDTQGPRGNLSAQLDSHSMECECNTKAAAILADRLGVTAKAVLGAAARLDWHSWYQIIRPWTVAGIPQGPVATAIYYRHLDRLNKLIHF